MRLMRMNPLLGEFGVIDRDDLWEPDGVTAGDWTPVVDILETDREITIKAELPGVEPRDIALTVDNNVLTLKGERRAEKEIKNENYHRMERAFGAFSRSFALPAAVDSDKVKADFKNGLLTITLPKKDTARGRTIEVHAA